MTTRVARVRGTLQVPGDKSLSHRALIVAAMGTGTSVIGGILQSADVRATAHCLRAMGWAVPDLENVMEMRGRGLRAHAPRDTALSCENSGTTARLMSGIAAAQATNAMLDGDASLRRRPMRRVTDPLAAMGATIAWRGAEGCLPLSITGGVLRTISWESPVASAQVKSAIMLAGLCAGVPVRVREPHPSRDHTERMLQALGVEVTHQGGWIGVEPVLALPATRWDIPGDPSSAAFFAALAAGAHAGSLTLSRVLLNPYRVGFMRALERMGVVFDVHNESQMGGEPVGDLVVHASPLVATEVSGEEIPSLIDELPMLAVLAALADGTTVIRGAEELRGKESDRIAVVVHNLRAAGVIAEELADGLTVTGPAQVRDASVATHGDHRIAMSFAVLGVLTGARLEVDQPNVVDVSYPAFWNDLARVTS